MPMRMSLVRSPGERLDTIPQVLLNERLALQFSAPQTSKGVGSLDAGGWRFVTRLAGKVALITGGGTGIGRSTALAFAREGAKVAVAGRRLEKLQDVVSEIKAAGGEAIAAVCDVSRAADALKAVSEVVATYGKLNVLVNNGRAECFDHRRNCRGRVGPSD